MLLLAAHRLVRVLEVNALVERMVNMTPSVRSQTQWSLPWHPNTPLKTTTTDQWKHLPDIFFRAWNI
jgi:hypothetical protein